MTLRVLKGGVTLHARYEDAVRAYDKESDFKHARLGMTFVFGHPTDNFPLNTYRGVPVHGEGVLMTSNTGWKYLVQRFFVPQPKYGDGRRPAKFRKTGDLL